MVELVTVLDGTLTLVLGGDEHVLAKDDGAMYSPTATTEYRNDQARKKCRFLLLSDSSKAGSGMTDPAPTEQRFTSRWGLILSVLGIAVGTGNIWRFPRIAANNGGEAGAGAFLVAWVVFLLVWSLPLIIAEYALGRSARKGVVGSVLHHGGPRRTWMGAFVGLTATAIMFYYSVVAGWCIHDVAATSLHDLPTTTAASTGIWESVGCCSPTGG
ncbi:MAG: hypothetical protein AAF799_25380 [Myxococcota bacterium]